MKGLLILLPLMALPLIGCQSGENGEPWAVQHRCVNGVTYYVSGYQMAPAYNRDGSLKLCGGGSND